MRLRISTTPTGINAVNLEYRLRDIKTNRVNLAHGRLPSQWFALTQPPFWHTDAAEWAPSTASLAEIAAALPHVRFSPKADIAKHHRHVR
jgi:hypothetical protein